METKTIMVNGKPEVAYDIVGTGKTATCDYSHDGNIHKVQDEIREQEVWRIIFRNWAFEIYPALPEGTVLTLDNIARVDYGKYPGDEEKKIPPFNINHWWSKVELILPNGNRDEENSGGLPPRKPLTAQEKAFVAQIEAKPAKQNKMEPPTITDILVFHVWQKITDNLDRGKQTPLPSQFFIAYCRDKLTMRKMERKNGWAYRTLKDRKKELTEYLADEFNGLTLEMFFVDRAVFSKAEYQLAVADNHNVKSANRRHLGNMEINNNDDEKE